MNSGNFLNTIKTLRSEFKPLNEFEFNSIKV